MNVKTALSQARGYWWIALLVVVMSAPLAFSQSVVTCSSDDMGYHTCAIGPNRGIRMVRQRSGSACVQGQTFGVRGESIWVNRGCRADFEVVPAGRGGYGSGYGGGYAAPAGTITCSSDDMRRHFCNIPNDSRVRLARQRSDAACVEGQTWGYRGNQLWVDRGCRADFEVIAGGRPGWDHDHDRDHFEPAPVPPPGPSVRTVTCSSDDMHRHVCDVGPNNGIRLLKQRSDARCDYGRSYGFGGNQIWVDRGCRADFEVVSGRSYH